MRTLKLKDSVRLQRLNEAINNPQKTVGHIRPMLTELREWLIETESQINDPRVITITRERYMELLDCERKLEKALLKMKDMKRCQNSASRSRLSSSSR